MPCDILTDKFLISGVPWVAKKRIFGITEVIYSSPSYAAGGAMLPQGSVLLDIPFDLFVSYTDDCKCNGVRADLRNENIPNIKRYYSSPSRPTIHNSTTTHEHRK